MRGRTQLIAYSCSSICLSLLNNFNLTPISSNILDFRLFNITIAIYGTLSEVLDHGFQFSFKEIGLIVDALYCSVLLFIFCDCSHTSTQQVAQGVQDT